jgi:thiosulfate dehydrogenase
MINYYTRNCKYQPLFFLVAAMLIFQSCTNSTPRQVGTADTVKEEALFVPPDTSEIPEGKFGDMIRYGRELIVNTAYYLGPDGTVGYHLNNKMNCGNCHLDAGTRPYALNYFSSHARYPQYRGRENEILSLADRVNNCIERPHHGRPIPLDSKEMVAIISYIKWLGQDVPVGKRVKGDNGIDIKFPDRPADPERGAVVYATHCASCHGANGQGQWRYDSVTYAYPPLWGMQSYEEGSSMHRVLKAARFIKANMPDKKAFWYKPVLTDEEAIDVAAFINDDRIHPRPVPAISRGYDSVQVKPIDYGVGPFADTFSEMQHKFGPHQPIIDYHKAKNLPIVF